MWTVDKCGEEFLLSQFPKEEGRGQRVKKKKKNYGGLSIYATDEY